MTTYSLPLQQAENLDDASGMTTESIIQVPEALLRNALKKLNRAHDRRPNRELREGIALIQRIVGGETSA